jgi:hypothetical protein
VDIDEKQQLFSIFFFEFGDVVYDCDDFWENKLSIFAVLTVKILSSDASSSIAQDDAIRIKHGYDFEDHFTSEVLCFRHLAG